MKRVSVQVHSPCASAACVLIKYIVCVFQPPPPPASPFPSHQFCVYVCALLIAAIWPCFSRTKQTVEEKITTTTATPIQQLPGLPPTVCVCESNYINNNQLVGQMQMWMWILASSNNNNTEAHSSENNKQVVVVVEVVVVVVEHTLAHA